MKIIYEDESIIVVGKEAGEATQTSKGYEEDLVSKIKLHLSKNSGKKGDIYVGVVHRLDQVVSGLLVFAKDKKAAADLSRQVQSNLMNKIYTATVQGIITENGKEVVDYVYKDSQNSKCIITTADDPKGKIAKLSFELLKINENDNTSTLKIKLETGRFHQIRAQLSNMGFPIVGDVKYGAEKSRNKGIMLKATEIEFIHPKTKKNKKLESF